MEFVTAVPPRHFYSQFFTLWLLMILLQPDRGPTTESFWATGHSQDGPMELKPRACIFAIQTCSQRARGHYRFPSPRLSNDADVAWLQWRTKRRAGSPARRWLTLAAREKPRGLRCVTIGTSLMEKNNTRRAAVFILKMRQIPRYGGFGPAPPACRSWRWGDCLRGLLPKQRH